MWAKDLQQHKLLSFCQVPTYLWIKLSRSLTFCRYLGHCAKIYLFTCTFGITWRLGMGCWCQSIAYSCPVSVVIDSFVLRANLVLQRKHSLYRPWALLLNVWVPMQQTTYTYFQASTQLNFTDHQRYVSWLAGERWTLTIYFMVF